MDEGDQCYIKLYYSYKVLDEEGKFSKRRTSPFKVLERIGRLAYRLDIPESFSRIYPVISVTHLEPVAKGPDLYRR